MYNTYYSPNRIANGNFSQLRVLNIVGEVVYTENLDQFVGEYTKHN